MHHKHNYNICHQCGKPGINLVNPCGNERCIVRIHPTCLENQIESNNEVCVKCSRPIIHNTVQKVNYLNLFHSLFTVLTYIIGLLLPILLIMGNTLREGLLTDIMFFRFQSKEGDNIDASFLISLILLFFLYVFYFIVINEIKVYNNVEKIILKYFIFSSIKNRNLWLYINRIIVYIINLLIVFCQLFGFVILRYIVGKNYFNCATFFTGLIFLIILGLFIIIIYGIVYGCKKLYQQNLEEKTMYGVVIDI